MNGRRSEHALLRRQSRHVLFAEQDGPLAAAAFRLFLGENDMLTYLSMMGPRLVELHRVLKSAGSLYLHCDPTASHYLKLALDAGFSPVNFAHHITWRRSDSHSGTTHQFAGISDHILFYQKTPGARFNPQHGQYPPRTLREWHLFLDLPDGTTRRMTPEEIDELDYRPFGRNRSRILDPQIA